MDLTTITIITGLLGIIILALLFSVYLEANKELKLQKFRKKDEGFTDLLNYAAVVDDGVILNKNGSLMAAWAYSCPDSASATVAERNAMSARINQAISKLGSGWMFHVDSYRTESINYPSRARNYFPDPITEAMDEERRRIFEHIGTLYETGFVLTATYYPPKVAEQKLSDLMFDDDKEEQSKEQQTLTILDKFKRDIITLESSLSAALNLTRLKGIKTVSEDGQNITKDDFLSWLQFCITGEHQPVLLPNNPIYLDRLIGGQEFIGGIIPKVGNKFIQVVAIDGYPQESTPGILNTLSQYPSIYRWSSRFIFMEQHEAEALLEKYRKKWKQKVRGFWDQLFNTNSGRIDLDAQAMVDDAEAALAETKSGLVAQGFLTTTVILMGENRSDIEKDALAMSKEISKLGFNTRIETLNTIEAYLGSLPGHGVENIRRPIVNTLNFADLMPTSSIWTGSENAPCPLYPANSPALMHCVTTGYSPFRLNLHVGDVGHTLIFGPTGSGKSTLLCTIVAQFRRYQNASIYCFDKGMSMYALTKASGGDHYELGSSDTSFLAFCPLQYIHSSADRAWAATWIEEILKLNNIEVTIEIRNQIFSTLNNMAENNNYTMTDFVNLIQNNEVRDALVDYTIKGQMGSIFDAENDNLSLSNFMCFEIEELMQLPHRFAIPVLQYIFRRIEMSLKGQPGMIILDEAWLMLSHEMFKEKIREWLKVLRKANCIVVLATQSLADAAKSSIFDALLESTPTKIFLPNPNAQVEETSIIYKNMGLNSRQIEILANSRPKHDYYYSSPKGHRLFNLALGKFQLAFVASSDKDSVAKMKKLQETYQEQWVDHWLSDKGLSLNNYQ
ncbi:VirB4 family type IV secretion/conjugal transfer ATPase [Pasteurella multocida]|uniref:VirB4 family type IV secretion/conjugal transfer ATPase n=1 Tax=Pasteurella multocida TaxID=747 RepID=UPI0009F6221B|nr:VirB4 family type IV secretion/conjugal transfer ATPase [Pasteurella multocida]MEB3502247.1 VirB4 family type IV secretion/conjugal transfer ATPase [Pasteurella multocida]PNM06773.1 VirB4 family type IV secretion/conjugal transfer ATPase [Pasteurella multocida]